MLLARPQGVLLPLGWGPHLDLRPWSPFCLNSEISGKIPGVSTSWEPFRPGLPPASLVGKGLVLGTPAALPAVLLPPGLAGVASRKQTPERT